MINPLRYHPLERDVHKPIHLIHAAWNILSSPFDGISTGGHTYRMTTPNEYSG